LQLQLTIYIWLEWILFVAAASPPKTITFDELMAAAKNLTDWTLAHEIAVNTNFCIKHDLPQNR